MPPLESQGIVKLRMEGEVEVPLEIAGALLHPERGKRWFQGDILQHYTLRHSVFLDEWTYHLEVPFNWEVVDG